MEILNKIQKTREYLDYIEEHCINVKKAWEEVKQKCRHLNFIYDDYLYNMIDYEIYRHDISKLSEQEFIQYRKVFYPTDEEKNNSIDEAWEHHKANNPHHWENWTKIKTNNPHTQTIHCVHMVVDWIAMGYKFGDTAHEYYEKNKNEIILPEWATRLIYEIFEKLKD